MLLKALFSEDRQYAEERFNISHMMNELQQRYNQLQMPQGKRSRPGLNTMQNWKVDQVTDFCHYFMIPLLHGYLDEKYYSDLCIFHKAITIADQPELTEKDRKEMREMFFQLNVNISTKWSVLLCIFNLHDSIHLSEQVEETGSLKNTSGKVCEAGLG